MILDKENLLSYKQAITVTANSANVIDLGPNHHMGGSGHDKSLPMMLAIDEVFTDTGSDATLRVQVQSSNAEAFGSGVRTHYDRTLTFAEIAQTGRIDHGIALPPDVKRYVRATYTVASGPFTAGKLTLGLVASQQING
jgi:hypothetical protein